jgi:hypothetical protein
MIIRSIIERSEPVVEHTYAPAFALLLQLVTDISHMEHHIRRQLIEFCQDADPSRDGDWIPIIESTIAQILLDVDFSSPISQ